MNVHYSATSRTVYIDENTRVTAINLPADLDPVEVAQVLQSNTLRAIIAALIEKGNEDVSH